MKMWIMPLIFVFLCILCFHSVNCDEQIEKSGSNDHGLKIDLATILKNRPIMHSSPGKPIRPSIVECNNCHDTNAVIREKSLSEQVPAENKEKWSLSMKLEKIEDTDGTGVTGSFTWFYILSLILKYISSIAMLFVAIGMAYMYWSSQMQEPSTRTHRVNTLELHDIYSSSPSIGHSSILRGDGSVSGYKDAHPTPSTTPKSSSTEDNGIGRASSSARPRPMPFNRRFTDESLSSSGGSINQSSPDSPQDLNLSPDQRKTKRYDQMSDIVLKQAKKVMTREEFKNDLAFILFVCNIVETRIVKRDNINKKQLVVDTLTKLFEYSEEEIKTLDRNIEFLHSNGLIKKDGIIRQMQSYWIKKP
jgi:hypothetical protein